MHKAAVIIKKSSDGPLYDLSATAVVLYVKFTAIDNLLIDVIANNLDRRTVE